MAMYDDPNFILKLPDNKALKEKVDAEKKSSLNAGKTPSAKEAGTSSKTIEGTGIENYVDRNLPKELTESSKKTLIKAPSVTSAKGTGTRINIPITSGSGTKPSLRQSTIDPKRPNIVAKDLGKGGTPLSSILAEGLTMLAGGLLGGNDVALGAGDYMNKFISREDALKNQRAMQQGQLNNEAAKIAEESYAAQMKARGEQDKLNVDMYKSDSDMYVDEMKNTSNMVNSALDRTSREGIANTNAQNSTNIANARFQMDAAKANQTALNKEDKDKKGPGIMVRTFDYETVTLPDGTTRSVETPALTLRSDLKPERVAKVEKFIANQDMANENYNNIIQLTKDYDMTNWTNTSRLKTALAAQKAILKDALELGAITSADAELIEPLIPDVSAFTTDRPSAIAALDEVKRIFKSKYSKKIAPLTVEGQNKLQTQKAKAQRFLELSKKMEE